MGISNLKQALESKMGLWAGELADQEAQEAQILALFEQLPAVQKRTGELRDVLKCAEGVMHEIDPVWSIGNVKPSKPCVHKNPVQYGNVAKFALDVLREAPQPLTSRQIAEEVLRRDEVDPDQLTKKELQGVVNSVNATLKQKLGTVTAHDGGFVRRWRIELPPLRAVS